MNKNYTDITVVLDSSGSMGTIVQSTIDGYNEFIDKQRKDKGTTKVSLISFNDNSNTIYAGINIKYVEALTRLTYIPGGNTALLDALGSAIDCAGARFRHMEEKDRPDKVIILVITDGQENYSKIYSKAEIRSRILMQQDLYNWAFVFIGANQDSFLAAKDYGISAINSLNYVQTQQGTKRMWDEVTCSTQIYKCSTLANNQDYFAKGQQ
jgi:Mg-chelatase subunit ChlD